MVNYSKWDAIGDSSDDEAPSRLAQDVETKLAVAPPQAQPELVERGGICLSVALLSRGFGAAGRRECSGGRSDMHVG